MIKGSRFAFVIFFSVGLLFVSLAQHDTTKQQVIKKTLVNDSQHLLVPKNNISYYSFFSEEKYKQELAAKAFPHNYSVVTIFDTIAGVSRKRSAVIFENKLTIPFQYDSIRYGASDEFICREYLVGRRSFASKVILYNCKTQKITDLRASSIQYVSDNLYMLHINGNKHFYNSATSHFSSSLNTYRFLDSLFILTSVAEQYKLLHRNGTDFISSPFKALIQSNDSVYNAVLYNQWDIYRNSGEKLFDKLLCDSIQISNVDHSWKVYRNDSLFFRRNSSHFYLNTSKPFVPITLNHSPAVIDKFDYDTMKMRINFDTIYQQSDYLYLYKKVGKYGYCDTIGNVKIAHQYDTITDWHENMAAIRMKNKWGYITKREQMTVQPYYLKALPFTNGAAAVYDGKKWMFITKDGKNINSISFDSIRQTTSGKWYVYSKGLIGICDTNGREIIPPSYEYILDANANVFVYKTEGLYGLMAKDRTVLCKPIYDQFIYDLANDCLLLKHVSETPLLFVIPKK